jgi:hypothetical protein
MIFIAQSKEFTDIQDWEKYFLDMGRYQIPQRKTIWNPE